MFTASRIYLYPPMSLSSDTARCEGRSATHPYYKECESCKRRIPPSNEYQSYITPWEQAHGPCPDKLEVNDD